MNNSKPMVCKSCGYDVFISGTSNLELYQDSSYPDTTRCNDTDRTLLMWNIVDTINEQLLPDENKKVR